MLEIDNFRKRVVVKTDACLLWALPLLEFEERTTSFVLFAVAVLWWPNGF